MEAANVLLQRSYPEIAESKQSKVIFIPEFFLPNCAAFVDGTPQHFSDRLEKSDMDKKEKQSLKVAARGDFGERQFFDELKKTFGNKDIPMIILQGSKMIIPKINQIRKNDPNKAEHEADFIIINQEHQYIMSLEIKNSLFTLGGVKEISVKKGAEQLSKIKSILETLFCVDIDAEKWKFVGAIGYIKMEDHVKCCQKCKNFILETKDVENFFSELHLGKFGNFSKETSKEEDYKYTNY